MFFVITVVLKATWPALPASFQRVSSNFILFVPVYLLFHCRLAAQCYVRKHVYIHTNSYLSDTVRTTVSMPQLPLYAIWKVATYAPFTCDNRLTGVITPIPV
jgi:hypothetical protein